MNGLTRFFLILLRFAIGWHFLFEGIDKVESIRRGPTESSRPFSSEPYVREASGPLAPYVREMTGDPDAEALARLTPVQGGKGILSTSVSKDWDNYFERYVQYYGIASDPEQLKKAQAALEKAKEKAAQWLDKGVKVVDKSFSKADFKDPETTPDRVAELKRKIQQVRDMQDRELPAFQNDVEKARLRAAKAEVAQLRNELLADLKQPLSDSLSEVLTESQKKLPPMPESYGKSWGELSQQEWADHYIIPWGLVVVGGCLILGFFTRTAAFLGAMFLLMLYLVMPPIPGVPEVLRTEGKYFFVNKNLVEMLALLVLATSRTGYWVGLDGLVHYFNPFRRRRTV